jgi:Putative Flp pilus-assembly TadE/G-like
MRWVKDRREDGVAAVLFAVVATVMFGMGALVIDAGALYQERRELQTGADAAALALAQICSKAAPPCTNGPGLNTMAKEYADLNVADLNASATASIDTSTKEVTVIASTPNNNQVPFHFAPILGGATEGMARAKAKAKYGYPSSVKSFPLTFSQCEFLTMLALPYPPNPADVLPNPIPLTEHVIYLHDSANGNPKDPGGVCPVTPSGMDADGVTTLTGGFGSLQQSGSCFANVKINEWYPAGPGSDPPANPCVPSDILNNPITLPVFDKIDVTCAVGISHKCYHVWGFASFKVTAMHLGGNGTIWSPSNPSPCNGSDRCIRGYFLTFTTAGEPGGPNGGTSVVYLTE